MARGGVIAIEKSLPLLLKVAQLRRASSSRAQGTGNWNPARPSYWRGMRHGGPLYGADDGPRYGAALCADHFAELFL
jgi:hypothetical protein